MALGVQRGGAVEPDVVLLEALRGELRDGDRSAPVASFDLPEGEVGGEGEAEVATDMQTAALLARAPGLGIAAAALLIVAEGDDGTRLDDAELEEAAKRAGRLAGAILSG